MNFDEHLDRTRTPSGTYDLAAAAQSRADEIAQELADNPGFRGEVAAKAAQSERRAWESRNRDNLKGAFKQPTLPLEGVDLEAKVPLGADIVIEMGNMDVSSIRARMDLRTDFHIRELDAFGREMEFWRAVLRLLPPGGTVADIPA
jgi:hypothetical protein